MRRLSSEGARLWRVGYVAARIDPRQARMTLRVLATRYAEVFRYESMRRFVARP